MEVERDVEPIEINVVATRARTEYERASRGHEVARPRNAVFGRSIDRRAPARRYARGNKSREIAP